MGVTNYLLIGMILQVPGVFSPGPFDSPLIGGHKQALKRVTGRQRQKGHVQELPGWWNLPSTLGMMKSYPRVCRDSNNHKPLYEWNPTQLYALKLVLLCFLRLSTWALLKRVCHRSASALIKWAARTPHCAVSFHGSTGKKSGRENWQAKASWDTSIPYVICLQTSTHICIFVIYNIIYIYTEIYLHIRFHYLLRNQNISPTRIPPWKKKGGNFPFT